jgi:hypothetical protein
MCSRYILCGYIHIYIIYIHIYTYIYIYIYIYTYIYTYIYIYIYTYLYIYILYNYFIDIIYILLYFALYTYMIYLPISKLRESSQAPRSGAAHLRSPCVGKGDGGNGRAVQWPKRFRLRCEVEDVDAGGQANGELKCV